MNPGKFENEPAYTEYYWSLAMQGFSDDEIYDLDDTPISVFKINPDDRAKHGFSEDTAYLILWEEDQGFVSSFEFTESEYESSFGLSDFEDNES